MRALALPFGFLTGFAESFQVVVEDDASFFVLGHKGFQLASGDIELAFNGTLYSTNDQSLRIGYFDKVHGTGLGFTSCFCRIASLS